MIRPTPDRPADDDLRRVVALVTMLRGYSHTGRPMTELLIDPAAAELLAEGDQKRTLLAALALLATATDDIDRHRRYQRPALERYGLSFAESR